MSELPSKQRSEPSRLSELKDAGKPVHISIQTDRSSDSVIQSTYTKGQPTSEEVQSLVSSVERDLESSGIPLKETEKQSLEATAKNLFTPQEPLPGDDAGDKQFEVALPEYLQYFGSLSKAYGLDKQKIKFGAIEGLILQGNVIRSLSGIGVAGLLMGLWNEKAKLPHTSEYAWRFMTERLRPGTQIHTPKGPEPAVTTPDNLLSAFVELKSEAKRFKWPVALTLAVIPSIVGEVAGNIALTNAMKDVRRSINDRAANSLFMRDLEFIHDKSAAEINNIIEKGKQSTLDLFMTTYSEVMPRLAAIGLGTVGQLPINPIGTVLQLARMPLMYGASKEYAKDVLKQRANDLKRKDQIDTRINATLGSLEIIKTSDSMEEGIGQLKEFMTARDEFQATSTKETIKQRAKMEVFNDVLGYGIPIVTSGIHFLMGKSTGEAVGKGVISKFGGNIIERNTRELVEIYIDKIQPALQDIKRMENLLGPYDELDRPDSITELTRKPVSSLPSFDISVRNVNYKHILRDVSLDIPQGSFVTLKGESGSGKTTLMRHMLGLFDTGQGSITYGGMDMKQIKKFGDESIYSAIAYANQNPQFFENMTLRDNLLLWTKKEISSEAIGGVLHDLRLDHLAPRLDSSVKHFSGGELRRIGIARALLKNPKVLFLDEPTANLDSASSRQVLQIIQEMRKTRPDMTVIAVTHDPDFEAIAERVVDFAEVNRPNNTRAESLGTRQVFYATADSASKR